MTPQEIISQARKLPIRERREVVRSLSQSLETAEPSEAEIAEMLLAKGVIKQIPDGWNAPDEDFEPIKIKGKPLSETIIEDRN